MSVRTVGTASKIQTIHRLAPHAVGCYTIRRSHTIEMQPNELFQHIAQTGEFPADSEEIRNALGEQIIDPPTGKSKTVNEILTNQPKITYNTPDEVYTTIVGNLDEAFIGRKHYDDRAGTVTDNAHTRKLHSF